jgi:ketosteroid isomerase-like protein
MAQAWRDSLGGWEQFSVEVDEFRELDDERVLVLTHFSGRGKTSGMDLGQMRTKAACVFHVRDGRVFRYVAYWDRERAFADLGLSSEASS